MTKNLVALFVLLVTAVFGQTAAPAFEAATIKPGTGPAGHSGWHTRTAYMVINNQSLKELAATAYHFPTDRVSGGPKWVDSDRFDIEARAAGPAKDPEMLIMLQSLLAERFQLATHRETKILPGYALTLAKDGLKIRPDEGEGGSSTNSSRGRIVAKRISMERFTNFLSRVLEMPVVDSTDAKGTFTFTLEWAAEPRRSVESPDKVLADVPDGPSLFTVLQKELGLKLESKKVPTELLVIDKAEKPSEN
jgi:uncharacterized protein (TIGR03435 family)